MFTVLGVAHLGEHLPRERLDGFGQGIEDVGGFMHPTRSCSAVPISKPSFATTSGITTSIGLTSAFDSKCPHHSAQ
jgi:hypothetical protein